MNKFLLILALLTSITTKGQVTIIQKVKSFNGSVIEKYYVLNSNKEIKHGDYKRYYRSKLVAEGSYNHGEKEIFKYYYLNDLPSVVYDYAHKKVLSYDKNENYKDVYPLNGTEELIIDRPPLPLFSRYELEWFIANNIKYPTEAAENGQSGKVQILAVINEEGNITKYNLISGVVQSLNREALRVVNLIPKEWKWIPAIRNGQPIESAIVLSVNFKTN